MINKIYIRSFLVITASQRQLDKTGQAKLKNLKEELENIQKTKEAHGVTP